MNKYTKPTWGELKKLIKDPEVTEIHLVGNETTAVIDRDKDGDLQLNGWWYECPKHFHSDVKQEWEECIRIEVKRKTQ